MLIGMTDDLRIVNIRSSELKLHSNFFGWYCPFKKYSYLLDQPNLRYSHTACKNTGEICNLKLCWCGSDIEIPKAVDKRTLDTFLDRVCEDKPDGWYSPDSDTLVAVGDSKYVIDKMVHIEWNMLRRCNYDCSYCPDSVHDRVSKIPSASESIGHFELHLAAFLDDLTPEGGFSVGMTGGEPTLIKGIVDVVKYIKSVGASAVRINTNGSCRVETLVDLHEHASLVITLHDQYLNKALADKIVKFIKTTPHRNEVSIKFLSQSQYYENMVVEELSGMDINWLSVKVHPLLDKSNVSNGMHVYTLKRL